MTAQAHEAGSHHWRQIIILVHVENMLTNVAQNYFMWCFFFWMEDDFEVVVFFLQRLSRAPPRPLLLCPWSQSESRLWLAPVWSSHATSLLPTAFLASLAVGHPGWKSAWVLNGVSTLFEASLSTVKTKVKSASSSRTGYPCLDTLQGVTARWEWNTYDRVMPRLLRSHWRGHKMHSGEGQQNSLWMF